MIAIALVLLASAPESPRAVDPQMKVTLFAESPDIVTPTGIAVDSRGRVLCIESHTHFRPEGYKGPAADRIRRFEDTEGDGRADKIATVFEGSKHTMSMAFGPGGALFVATRNEVFSLPDRDGDEFGPKATLVRLDTPGNYPHNGLSGVTFDFDGTLYFGLGENLGADYKLIGSDGATLKGGGEGGNVYRCRPDGSKLERVATGFWNPFAMTFDAFGRLFAVDNDPDSRPPCRLLQIVDGGDYGYRFRNGRKGLHPFTSWNGELPGTLPMVAGTGEAPSGIVAYESDAFPSYRGDLLVTSWGDHRIDRFRLRNDLLNTTLKASGGPMIAGGEDFRPVGIVVAPDGSLFVSDWVDKSYELHGKGRIWHITPASPAKRADRALGACHPDRAIRDAAARTLAESGEAGRAELMRMLTDSTVETRFQISALHALMSAKPDVEGIIASVAKSQKADLEAETLRILPQDQLARIDRNTFHPFAAAVATYLRRGGKTPMLLQPAREGDPFFQQAERMALRAKDDTRTLINMFKAARSDPRETPFRRWRLQVLLALRESSDPAAREILAEALTSDDPEVRFVAIQWVGEEGLSEYRERLLGALDSGTLTNGVFEGTLAAIDLLDGRKPQANDETGGEALVARLAADPQTTPAVRRRALRVLRPDHPSITPQMIDSALASPDDGTRVEAVRTLRESTIADRATRLLRLASDPAQSRGVRAEAVAGIAGATEAERDALVALARDPVPAVRRQAIRSLRDVTLTPEQGRAIADAPSEISEPAMILLGGPPISTEGMETVNRKIDRLRESFPPDPDEGQRVFFHPKGAGCFKCHRIEGRGGRVGPDLTATGPAMGRWKLVESILSPDREISPQFTTWQVVRHDGTQVQGVLVEESVNGDQTYADADGRTTVVKGNDLAERRPLTTSVMPRGLGEKLSTRDFSDLIAFLTREPVSPLPDNFLTPEEQAAGWKLLFDGKTLDGWMTSSKAQSKTPVENGTINPHGSGGYMMIHEKPWEDFVLSLDFKISPKCNSGVFVRTFPLEPRPGKDVGFNGIEIAIDDTKEAGFHDTGAIYDLVRPSKNAMKPVGEWNHMEITCDGPKIEVKVNGETVTTANLDEWTEKNKRPDGTEHKFDIAYKNHPRRGYIGLQDHGSDCWYKNIKLRELRK